MFEIRPRMVVFVRKLHNRVLAMSMIAVVGVQREQEGAEHTALGGTGVHHESGGGVTANLNCLRSVCEEVHDPLAECGTQAQSAEFVSVSWWGLC